VLLTSDYYYDPSQMWGIHSWSYRVIRKVTKAEQPTNAGGLVKAFYANWNTGNINYLDAIQATTRVEDGAWAWA
jgi:hypothetical protein